MRRFPSVPADSVAVATATRKLCCSCSCVKTQHFRVTFLRAVATLAGMKKWYTIEAKAAERTAEITIFDSIGATWDGEGVTAKQFIADLKALDAEQITLLINSPGGSVFDGLAIYNALVASGAEITGKVMGVAASAASFILMACKRIVMPENSFLMIHNASSIAWGDSATMRETADWLDKIGDSIVNIYATRTGKSVEQIKSWLNAETWFSAAEAKDNGFADEVGAAFAATAQFEVDKLPENVRKAFASATPPVTPPADPAPAAIAKPLAEQIKALATERGLPEMAAVLATASDITNVAEATAALTLASEVKALCVVAEMPDRADALMRNRTSLSEVRAQLCKALAEANEAEVDTSKPTNRAPNTSTAQIDHAAIYEKANTPTNKRST
jgi:ATP-dependent Clp endopeptidase proteolytic subunit ClpP